MLTSEFCTGSSAAAVHCAGFSGAGIEYKLAALDCGRATVSKQSAGALFLDAPWEGICPLYPLSLDLPHIPYIPLPSAFTPFTPFTPGVGIYPIYPLALDIPHIPFCSGYTLYTLYTPYTPYTPPRARKRNPLVSLQGIAANSSLSRL